MVATTKLQFHMNNKVETMKIAKSRIIAEVTGKQAIIYFLASNVRELGDVQKIMEEIEEVAYNYDITLVVINFSKLKSLTSAFLSKLVTLNKSLRTADIELRLCSMATEVERAYKICKLQKLIPLFKSEAKALK